MTPGDSIGDHTETSVLSIKWYFVVLVVVVVVVVVVVGRLTCLLRVMWWDWAVSRQADKDSPPGWSLLSLSPAQLSSQAAGEPTYQLTHNWQRNGPNNFERVFFKLEKPGPPSLLHKQSASNTILLNPCMYLCNWTISAGIPECFSLNQFYAIFSDE